MWRRDVRPPSDSKIPNKKPAADGSARAFRFLRRWLYASDLPDVSNDQNEFLSQGPQPYSSPCTGGATVFEGGFPAALAGCGKLTVVGAGCCSA